MTTWRDRALVAGLVLALVTLAGIVALPSPVPVGADPSDPGPSPDVAIPVYREGVLGRPVSITPLTARDRAERTLVGLVFSGLTRLGAGGTVEPDLAASWTASEDGRRWTVRLRDDARWHDGTAVTAEDVVFTVRALRAPDVAGPSAASWAEVGAVALDQQTVRFTLKTPLGGFAEAMTQPLLPAHLLADVPLAELAGDPFGRSPVGTGPYALTTLDAQRAVLEPAAFRHAPLIDDLGAPPTDSLATPAASGIPDIAVPFLSRIELRFYDDPTSLAAALAAGELDAASGLPPASAVELAARAAGAQVVRYPTTTLSTVILDQRAAHPELRDGRVRKALLGALDRDALILDALGGGGLRADAPIPPTAWVYDAESATRVKFDAKAARALLTDAGWKRVEGDWTAPRASKPYKLELLAPTAAANPTVNALALAVAGAWRKFGLGVDVVELAPAELATRLNDGDFAATVVDVRLGLDLDLYPLLAASQTTSGGGNVAGYQDPALDRLLTAARGPGTPDARRGAYRALLARLSAEQPILPLAWRDEVVVVRGVEGWQSTLVVDAGDRFWDVLAWRLAAGR